MVEADALNLLKEAGHEVRIHAVLNGGQALNDTMQGLAQVLINIPDIPIVVWLNEYFGSIVHKKKNSGEEVSFEESPLYTKNKTRFHALIRLPEVRKETFGFDVKQMMEARLTFDEAVQFKEFPIMSRQRLKMTWRGLQSAMEQAVL